MADNDPARRQSTELDAGAVYRWRELLDAYRTEYRRNGGDGGGEKLFADTLRVHWKHADRTPSDFQQLRFDELASDAREDDTVMRDLWPQNLCANWLFSVKGLMQGTYKMHFFEPGILIAVAADPRARAESPRKVFRVDYTATEGNAHWQATNAMMAITGRIVAYAKPGMTKQPYVGMVFYNMHGVPYPGLDPDIGPDESLRRIRLLLPHMIVGQYNDMGARTPPVL